ncbi:LacI family DNA-binding transcriptional regulator [Pontibacillus sp. ALD_SL1]|uniref:LacI family DNA-binding transcriptional regulator n=1 Tax=Pontibacillus sp. ALD_SL1 TaxID=2777185 RepID=UPI001A95CFB3|nr:LacI family DNA-binding transcriptional regulator [Pontibacillus sp. ALD_SL1]QSS98789.1 LacI family DNA-binding transcriptional regulator [Pontibacillus sp. ALD_SL1]
MSIDDLNKGVNVGTRVSIKDVAVSAGVSTATVSHVINETRYVAEETKQKVHEAMRTLRYSPNSIARSLRSHQSNVIGLVIPVKKNDTSNFFFMSIAHGIESTLKKHGYQLILSNSNEELENEKNQIDMLNSQIVDGVILAPTVLDHNYLENEAYDFPIVFVDRKPEGYEGDCVLVDNFNGTYEAIKLLIDKGHDKIGYLSGPLGISTSEERYQGYKQALEDHGIEYKDDFVRFGEANYENGQLYTEELVDQESVSAIFIANNVMTIGAMITLQEKDIDIPNKLAVIGFDDYEWTKITKPPLTVIKQPAFELGEKAAEVLLEKIKKSTTPSSEYRLPTELVIRGSS